jgi:hypothetical protein
MFESKFNIFIGLTALALCLVLMLLYINVKNAPELSFKPANIPAGDNKFVQPAQSSNTRQPSAGSVSPAPVQTSSGQKTARVTDTGSTLAGGNEHPVVDPAGIDPERLERARARLKKNRIYEKEARTSLPTVSIQTHNPVWALEYEAARQAKTLGGIGGVAVDEKVTNQGPQPAPQAGEFGMIQPPEGEIWLRIPAAYAAEHKDIMAQNADLYRAETGYSGPVTITLWVGGRPYARYHYE